MDKDTGLGAGFSTRHLLEGLVNGPKPADVGAGCEEDEPEKGEAKVGGSPASDQPRETAHQVHGQRDAIHCRPRSMYTDTRRTADTHRHQGPRRNTQAPHTDIPITQHRPTIRHRQTAQAQKDRDIHKHTCKPHLHRCTPTSHSSQYTHRDT